MLAEHLFRRNNEHVAASTMDRETLMKKIVWALTVICLTLTTGVGTAHAAKPEKQRERSNNLYSYGFQCTPIHGDEQCSSSSLSAYTEVGSKDITVCVSRETYLIRDGDYTPISSESGCTQAAGVLTVDSAKNVSLAPTAVTIASYGCHTSDCQETEPKTVTVSSHQAATSRSKGTSKDGRCTYRYKYTSASAPVAGTTTIEGVAFAHEGSVSVTNYRTTVACR